MDQGRKQTEPAAPRKRKKAAVRQPALDSVAGGQPDQPVIGAGKYDL